MSGAAIGAIWLIAVSWRIKGATRVIGLQLALLYLVLSLHVLWALGLPGVISMLLNFVGILLIARVLRKATKPRPVAPKEDLPSLEWS